MDPDYSSPKRTRPLASGANREPEGAAAIQARRACALDRPGRHPQRLVERDRLSDAALDQAHRAGLASPSKMPVRTCWPRAPRPPCPGRSRGSARPVAPASTPCSCQRLIPVRKYRPNYFGQIHVALTSPWPSSPARCAKADRPANRVSPRGRAWRCRKPITSQSGTAWGPRSGRSRSALCRPEAPIHLDWSGQPG